MRLMLSFNGLLIWQQCSRGSTDTLLTFSMWRLHAATDSLSDKNYTLLLPLCEVYQEILLVFFIFYTDHCQQSAWASGCTFVHGHNPYKELVPLSLTNDLWTSQNVTHRILPVLPSQYFVYSFLLERRKEPSKFCSSKKVIGKTLFIGHIPIKIKSKR